MGEGFEVASPGVFTAWGSGAPWGSVIVGSSVLGAVEVSNTRSMSPGYPVASGGHITARWPDALSDRTVQRIVVRDGLSGDLADRLLHDIATETAYLDELVSPMPAARQHPSFHH
ncbi:MAG: glutamate decarboxylase [Actinomycetospora sp.]|nr:glutamate decarboxylase [Actinomycetospora sp.]